MTRVRHSRPPAEPVVEMRKVVRRADIRARDAECCNAHRDSEGRLPLGWCSPECVRRPVVTMEPVPPKKKRLTKHWSRW